MSFNPRVIFFLSTGRCSTQFLARLLDLGQPKALVVHEGAGPNYKPAQVFRRNEYDRVVAETHQLRDQFKRIEAQLALGKTFIDTGWPAYAWGPYFAQRFGAAFRFAHLVRNPFAIAASMSTHLLLDDRDDTLSKYGVIRAHHPQAVFAQFKGQYAAFSRYERGLFHWLEVNTYLLEQHNMAGFLGLYRFEEMYAGPAPLAKKLWLACGFTAESYQTMPPYDKYNIPARRFTPPNPELVKHVWALALRLGYSEGMLEKWSNIDFLTEHYKSIRVARPR